MRGTCFSHKDGGDLFCVCIHLNEPFEPRPCVYNSKRILQTLGFALFEWLKVAVRPEKVSDFCSLMTFMVRRYTKITVKANFKLI